MHEEDIFNSYQHSSNPSLDRDHQLIHDQSKQTQWYHYVIILPFLGLLAFVSTFLISSRLSPQSIHSIVLLDFNSINSLTQVNELSNKIEFGVMNDTEKTLLFGLFKKQFGKSYNTSEEDFRYHKFIKTLENIDTRNKEEKLSGGTASHGITKFADLSIEEFKETYLTASVNNNFVSVIGELAEVDPYEGEESYVDWIGRYTALIHDQGYCGSCWAFSVTEQLESDAVRKGLIQLNTTLSTQQIISCDSSSYGCQGGWSEHGFEYVHNAGGIALESSYPYSSYYSTSNSQQCYDDKVDRVLSIDNYYIVKTEASMMDHVKSTGPLSVCVDATNWISYLNGVLSSCDTDINHCVQIVGVDSSVDNGYWLIRNTWGENWGESGYIRVKAGENTCGIATDAIFTEPYFA